MATADGSGYPEYWLQFCKYPVAMEMETFTAATGSPITVGQSPYAVTTGDFNADGRLDLAVANYTSKSISILLGNGDGHSLR